jgi:hypothetical protein
LIDITHLLAANNALDGALGWIADSQARRDLLKLKDTMERPYGLDLLFQGYPYAFTNLAEVSGTNPHPIVFGAWDQLCIAEWSSIDILTNPYGDAYQRGGVQVRAAMSIDINRRHVESFAFALTTTITTLAAAAAPAPAPSRRATA